MMGSNGNWKDWHRKTYMDITFIKDRIEQELANGSNISLDTSGLQSSLYIEAKDLPRVCLFLRDTEFLYFDFLASVSSIDHYPEQKFTIVYHLTSIPYQKTLCLKVDMNNDRDSRFLPEIPSVSAIWRTAEWHEREVFDLMGIFFTDHPDLRRILLPDDWKGFPLRKDYEDPEEYHGIPIK